MPALTCRVRNSVLTLTMVLGLYTPSALADLRIAVAANFSHTLQQLVNTYSRLDPSFSATLSSASSGKHFAQIRQGAPFDLFFSADDQRTADLIAQGDARPDSRFTYALGQLALWSPDPEKVPADGLALLKAVEFRRLAIANPRVAPYGAAAEALLRDNDIRLTRGQLITGQSIGQAFNFVSSGNADLGLIAVSQVRVHEQQHAPGSHWLPPAASYPAIVQEAVILNAASNIPSAIQFMQWVRCDEAAHAIIRADGYLIPATHTEAACAGH
ncbi:MAG: molybdate ABC transporter substrate-binding protein [Marinobacter sp.]|nr:molybdate ABC transporter substrate-binding protein [Marinobacter sp.]